MADLTYDANLRLKGEAKTEYFTCHSGSAQTIYKGQPMIFNATDTLNAVAYVDSVDIAATDVFIGIAAEGKTVAAAAKEADALLEVYVGPSIVGFKSTVYTTNDKLGATVYMSDSGTLSEEHANNPQIGTLFLIEDGYCYVKLSAPQICTTADA